MQEKREMNLVEYNQKAYNLTLRFPWLPPVSGCGDSHPLQC